MDDGFLNLTPEHKQQKKKIDELDLIKIKKIPASKNTIKKVKKKKNLQNGRRYLLIIYSLSI